MFEPFPKTYVWNLSVNIALGMGAQMGEIDEMNRKVQAAATENEDSGTEAFFSTWNAMADKLAAKGRAEEAAGHPLSAAHKFRRAAIYYMTAERMQAHGFAPRKLAYKNMLESFAESVRLGGYNCEKVGIPYQGKTISGLFSKAPGSDKTPAPCMVFCQGLDSFKEMVYYAGVTDELAARGISTLVIDQPGTGEALRLHDMTAIIETERWAGACIDYLEKRKEVNPKRIGMMGWSLGGFYAPRAASFEKRFALCVAWGGNHMWGEVQRRRMQREGDRPVPHYWEHVMWVWGKKTIEEFTEFYPKVTLDGAVEHMNIPFLVTHGANDRQIPIEFAHRSYDQAVNSPKRELRIFTTEDGGVEHVSADNMEPVISFIADWIKDTFAEIDAGKFKAKA